MGETPESLRIDKWLWAARFFKTRSLAIEAINGGKIKINEHPTKPAKKVKTGDLITVSRGQSKMTVVVTGLNDKRRPASEAASLYNETEESRVERERQQALSRLNKASQPTTKKPTKKERRQIIQFKGK